MLHADQARRRRARARASSRGTRGGGRGPPPRVDGEQALEVLDARSRTSAASRSSSGRRRGGPPRRGRPWPARTCSSARRRTRAAACRSRPAAAARPGTYPRERLRSSGRPSRPRATTESSVRVSIGRSCSRKRSAISASRSHGVLVLVGDRLVGDVAARHTRASSPASASSRWWSGEYGSITPSSGAPGRHRRRRDGGVGAARGRARSAARGPEQQLLLGRPRSTSPRAPREVRRHQRERLVLAVLARPQLGHRRLVVGRGRRGGSRRCPSPPRSPRRAARGGGLDRVARAGSRTAARPRSEPHPRPAVRAGVGLGVEAAVGRVLVLGAAARAHLEARHRRVRPVVRDVAHDREARPAVGAVRERVAVAPVGGVEQLGEAVGAGGAVRRDGRARSPPAGLSRIAKPRSPSSVQPLGHDPLDRRQRRRLGRQPCEEALDRLRRAPRPRPPRRASRSARGRPRPSSSASR